MRLTIWITPNLPAALVRFNSPSGCPSFPRAVADYDMLLNMYVLSANPIAYHVHWQRRLLPEDSRRPVYRRDITQNARTEPYPGSNTFRLHTCTSVLCELRLQLTVDKRFGSPEW